MFNFNNPLEMLKVRAAQVKAEAAKAKAEAEAEMAKAKTKAEAEAKAETPEVKAIEYAAPLPEAVQEDAYLQILEAYTIEEKNKQAAEKAAKVLEEIKAQSEVLDKLELDLNVIANNAVVHQAAALAARKEATQIKKQNLEKVETLRKTSFAERMRAIQS